MTKYIVDLAELEQEKYSQEDLLSAVVNRN